MTFAMTSEVGPAHPTEPQSGELSSANDAHRYVGDHCLDDGPVGKVGLEVEAHCFDLADGSVIQTVVADVVVSIVCTGQLSVGV